MSEPVLEIRDVLPREARSLGRMMVAVYSSLPGFPKPEEQPRYFDMLASIADLAEKPSMRVLVAVTPDECLVGGVVYIDDMADYGSGGTATTIRNASGIRLLAVDPEARGMGVGKRLTRYCIDLARESGNREVILHTTAAMKVAWSMYENMGFRHSEELDFLQEGLQVYGFRLPL